jgi:GT2 family glycosyltransferase
MRSVAGQVGVSTRHVVLGDGCPALSDQGFLAELGEEFPGAIIRNVERTPETEALYLPARMGRLRNLGASLDDGAFVAQLDDDNTYQPDHLASLVEVLEAEPAAGAAHSWRVLHAGDGRPYVPDGIDPWYPDPAKQRSSYDSLVRDGVFIPGSAEVRDVFKLDGRLIARVDTSEFLVRRDVMERIGFPTNFSKVRQRLEWTEDFVFAIDLARAGVDVACSRRATLNYRMGGYSNARSDPAGS